jgi:uncharacterized protein
MKNCSFPQSRELTLDDKDFLDTIFARLQPRVSELTFANLFLFRSPHGYRLTRVGDSTVILGKGYAGGDYFLPPLDGDIGGALSRLFRNGLTLYGADEAFAAAWLGGAEVTEDRDNSDYLYLREALAVLPGRRFHNKKNRINYFTARHPFEVEIYRRDHLPGCLELLDEWRRVREGTEGGSSSFESEVAATREGLELAGELGLQGVVVRVEGRVKGFALGERLNDETSLCHFEKGDPFMDGLYQLVDREFNRLLFTDCTYVNREQDLGEPGLRESKLSYHPIQMIRKFRASAKV